MNIREYCNNNPAVVTGGAVLVLVLCLSVIAWQLFGGGGGSSSSDVKLVYYDVATNSILLVPAKDRPASPLADNDKAYRTMILSCGECGELKEGMTRAEIEAAGMTIAYLNKDSDGEDADPLMGRDMLVSSIDAPDQWYTSISPEGGALMGDPWVCPGNTRAKQCQP